VEATPQDFVIAQLAKLRHFCDANYLCHGDLDKLAQQVYLEDFSK